MCSNYEEITLDKKPKEPTLFQKAILSERTKKFDPNATEDDCLKDLRRVQEKNPDKYITRNFYRVYGNYSDSTWNRHVGTFHEFRRQAGLELSRHQHKLEKQVALHRAYDVYTEFQDKEIKPWINRFVPPENKTRYKTILVCSDIHDVNLDPFTWGVFLDVAKRVNPDIICLAGDVYDETEYSKYEFDPRKSNLKEAFSFVQNEVFGKLRKICPDTRIDFVIGNHDWRIIKHIAEKSPYMRILLSDVMDLSLSDLLGLKKHQINLVCRIDLNEFSPAATRNQIKKNFEVYYDTLVIDHHEDQGFGMSGCSGHFHRTGMHSTVNLTRGPIHWVQMGAMCRLDFAYQERMNKSHQSFVLWHIDTETKQASPEHVIFSDSHCSAVGKFYTRSMFEK